MPTALLILVLIAAGALRFWFGMRYAKWVDQRPAVLSALQARALRDCRRCY